MDVLELLAENGMNVSFEGGRQLPETLEHAFKNVKNCDSVLIFGNEVTDDELSMYLTDETDAMGNVLHSNELDTLTLRRKADYYGNKAKNKRGPISVSQPIKREDGTPYGFVIRSK